MRVIGGDVVGAVEGYDYKMVILRHRNMRRYLASS